MRCFEEDTATLDLLGSGLTAEGFFGFRAMFRCEPAPCRQTLGGRLRTQPTPQAGGMSKAGEAFNTYVTLPVLKTLNA